MRKYEQQLKTNDAPPPVAIRFTLKEKTALVQRAAREQRSVANLARLIILRALEETGDYTPEPTVGNSGDPAQQQHATSVAAH